jgi:hypothetical protein
MNDPGGVGVAKLDSSPVDKRHRMPPNRKP